MMPYILICTLYHGFIQLEVIMRPFCLKIRFCPLRQLVEACRRNIHLHDSKGNRASEISVCNPFSIPVSAKSLPEVLIHLLYI